jgi:pyruvate/2-oxoglutarate/acetoin dehydrogenase E1 component
MTAVVETVRTITYREAMREAMCEAMRRDERVILMGEDVGRYGGCYPSKGMLESSVPREFGTHSESAPVGRIGAALGGAPIVGS